MFVDCCLFLFFGLHTDHSLLKKRNIKRSILSATVVWKSIFVGNIKTAKSVLCDLPIG
jgi:hypothetical protein